MTRSDAPLIALAGNPNTGKTTLFNRLTGSRARVGNYPGVTVELALGEMDLGAGLGSARVVDVPGTYSLLARSHEEQLALTVLMGLDGRPRPELCVFCVDANNPVRNLYLVLQAMELGLNVVVVLTMVDEAGSRAPDAAALSAVLGCPVVAVVARTGQNLETLRSTLAHALVHPLTAKWRWAPSPPLTAALGTITAALPDTWPKTNALALWALMSAAPGSDLAVPESLARAVAGALPSAANAAQWDEEVITARYAWLDAHVEPLCHGAPARTATQRADSILIHPVAGFAVFLGIHLIIFQALFAWSAPAIDAISAQLGQFGQWVAAQLGDSMFTRFLTGGLIGGVGSVVSFLPQILLLFFFIGLMEDTGYMSRVAYLMDRIMRSLGLHGRAFVPMLSGFACAVPAILATRTMERQRDRILTMMVIPLMTCSARLPVYTLVIGALFSADARLLGVPVQSGIMVAMYVFSIGCALTTAWVLSKTVLRAPGLPLIMELPPYRLPRLGDVLRMMWQHTRSFLSQAGTVILCCSMALWVLLNFPQPSAADLEAAGSDEAKAQLVITHSLGGRLGHFIEPAIEPLGFDWKIGIGLIGAFAAREVFVATLGVAYSGQELEAESPTLRDHIRAERHPDGTLVYTPLMGLSLLIFFALACQCMGTLAVVKRETHGYRWPAFLFAYTLVLAWGMSFLTYQGGKLLGFG